MFWFKNLPPVSWTNIPSLRATFIGKVGLIGISGLLKFDSMIATRMFSTLKVEVILSTKPFLWLQGLFFQGNDFLFIFPWFL